MTGTTARLRLVLDPRRLGAVFVAAMALLIAHNVYWLYRNQVDLTCKEKLCVWPRELEKSAWASRNPKITDLAIYYLLNDRIGGARLTIPSWWQRRRWELEHLARLEVQVAERPLLVDPAAVRPLRKESDLRRRWVRRGEPAEGGRSVVIKHDVFFLFDDAAVDYVVAETDRGSGPIFVLPRARYAQVARR